MGGEEVAQGEVSFLDGQLEGDVHLSLLGQRDDLRKLHNLRDRETDGSNVLFFHSESYV